MGFCVAAYVIAGSTALASLPVPPCAWAAESSATTANLAFPDTDATYWVTPFQYNPDTQITVSGQYPEARFFSLDVYDSAAGNFTVNDVTSALVDYQIAPDLGSLNPWQKNAQSGGNYTVHVQSTVGAQNVIPIAPETRPRDQAVS